MGTGDRRAPARIRGANWQNVSNWVARILRLDFTAFDEVRVDTAATAGAIAVVLGASVLAGVGSWLWAVQVSYVESGAVLLRSLVLGSLVQTGVWLLWVYLVYQVLVHGYAARMQFSELARTMGFAFAPVGLGLLVAVTPLAVPFGVLSLAMAVLFTNVAIERTSGADIRETMLANLTGFAAFVVVMGVFANVAKVNSIGGVAPGILFFSLDR